MKRVADYVIEKIAEAGAKHIFMVTGRGILYLSDAVAKCENMEGVSMLHEQGASYAAMSYAKAADGIGACLVSTGCAAANAVTGALCAYQDNLPVVFVSGQHMLNESTRYTGVPIRTYGSQEADIISMVEPITKYAVMLTEAGKIVYELEKALHLATTGRKGPVWIDIPLDLQSVMIEPDELEHFIPESGGSTISDEVIDTIAEEINLADRPVLFVGGGASSSECKTLIHTFSEKTHIPVIFSYAGCDIYGSGNEYAIGAVNSLGAPRAGNFTLQNSDYVLVIGSKLCSQTIGDKPHLIARDARITVVDIDPNEHTKKGVHIDRHVISDAAEFLNELLKKDIKQCKDEWVNKCIHWKNIFDISNESFTKPDETTGRIDLYDFCNRISGKLGRRTAVITDAGLEELIVPSTIKYRDEQKCFFAAAQGAMGYAIPAIMGAHFAGYDDIVVIVGDGSVMMNIQELQLLNYHGIKARIFVINNDLYAVIRARQKDLFRKRTIGNDSTDGVPTPDFEKLAKAFGIGYHIIDSADVLDRGLDEAFGQTGSYICEVMCKTEQRYFHTSFRKNDNGKIVRPSIEDESPFLDRELFMAEMIVEPVEI
ncbi:MAG: thiamine pyrophosphate-binding protein [Lachnospiraceae bacterium]|nr:thiamine pyrophosphate-binding protein [Lachnospiraceae bacterium]